MNAGKLVILFKVFCFLRLFFGHFSAFIDRTAEEMKGEGEGE